MSRLPDFTNTMTPGAHIALLTSLGMTASQARAVGALFFTAADYLDELNGNGNAISAPSIQPTCVLNVPDSDSDNDGESFVLSDDGDSWDEAAPPRRGPSSVVSTVTQPPPYSSGASSSSTPRALPVVAAASNANANVPAVASNANANVPAAASNANANAATVPAVVAATALTPPSPLLGPWTLPVGYAFEIPSPGVPGPYYAVFRGTRVGVFSGWQLTASLTLNVSTSLQRRVGSIQAGIDAMLDSIDAGTAALLPQ
ncbi:hypothetical protein ONZ45_g11744 [Pleurotus djamor]|nr:hypothetical protein ONZ45_g11744 [Pleurotus djamor]